MKRIGSRQLAKEYASQSITGHQGLSPMVEAAFIAGWAARGKVDAEELGRRGVHESDIKAIERFDDKD